MLPPLAPPLSTAFLPSSFWCHEHPTDEASVRTQELIPPLTKWLFLFKINRFGSGVKSQLHNALGGYLTELLDLSQHQSSQQGSLPWCQRYLEQCPQDSCVYSRSKAPAQRVKLPVCTSARGQSQSQYSRSNDIWPREQSFAPPVLVAFLCFSDRLVAPCGKAVVPQTFLSVVSPQLIPSHSPLPFSVTSHSLPNPVHPSIMPIQLFMEPHCESAKGADPAKNKTTLQKKRKKGREKEKAFSKKGP